MPAPPSDRELRVFISSTFRDLQQEREYLVKKIFPEIRTLCREQGVFFTEVDLRWGLTEEEGTLGRILRTCLEEVDRCRPYLIGLCGDRYGWVPPLAEVYKDPQLLRQFPWIEEAVVSGQSVTEIEMRYGVLDEPDKATGSSFYFRKQRPGNGDADAEEACLATLKEKIRASGRPVREFRDPAALGEMIYEDLVAVIERDFGQPPPMTPLEKERRRHEAFAASRRRAYIPNTETLRRLDEYAASATIPGPDEGGERLGLPRSTPLVVVAGAGTGKSALVAHWVDRWRRKHPETLVIEHYVGIGTGHADHLAFLRQVMEELRERFAFETPVPGDPDEIEHEFPGWLDRASTEPILIVLDGLNQLQGSSRRLRWLPRRLPGHVRLVITSTTAPRREDDDGPVRAAAAPRRETHTAAMSRTSSLLIRRGGGDATRFRPDELGWTVMGIEALSLAEREALVVRFLSEYHKALPPAEVHRLAADDRFANPLCLRTVLEELRIFGVHEKIHERIDAFLAAAGAEGVFRMVLDRLAEDFGDKVVQEALTLLWASREGLTESELAELTNQPRIRLSAFVMALEFHLLKKDGLFTFFHDFLRRAVEQRYLETPEAQVKIHLRVADHFDRALASPAAGVAPARAARELLHQLASAGAWGRLADALARPEILLSLFPGEWRWEYLGHWNRAARYTDVPAIHRERIEAARTAAPRGILLDLLGTVVELLETTGRWEDATELGREAMRLAEESKEAREIGRASGALGWILHLTGNLDEALPLLERELEIDGTMGDSVRSGRALARMGHVHLEKGDFEAAMGCFEKALAIAETLRDRPAMTAAFGAMGRIWLEKGYTELAMQCFRDQLAVAKDFGDRLEMAAARGNMGFAYAEAGGREDRAIRCFRIAADYARAVGGFHRGLPGWLLGLAGSFVDAVAGGKQPSAAVARESGLLVRESLLSDADDLSQQALEIGARLGRTDVVVGAQLLTARIDAEGGRTDEARTRLAELAAAGGDLLETGRAEALYHLAILERDAGNGGEAKRIGAEGAELYRKLVALRPHASWQRRLAELQRIA